MHTLLFLCNIMTKILICLSKMQVVIQVVCNAENWNKTETELIKNKKINFSKKNKKETRNKFPNFLNDQLIIIFQKN